MADRACCASGDGPRRSERRAHRRRSSATAVTGMPKFTLTGRSDRRHRRVHAQLPRRRLRRVAQSSRRASSSATRRRARRSSPRSARRAIRRPAICGASRRRSRTRSCCSRRGCCRAAAGRGGPPPVQVKPTTVTVTLSSGEKVEGRLDRIDDFVVALTMADGTRRSFDHDGRHAESRDPRSAAAAQGSAADVFRRGHPQRDGFPGDTEMTRTQSSPRSQKRSGLRGRRGASRSRCSRRAAGGSRSVRPPQTARRLLAELLRRLHRPPLQHADAGQPVEREEPDAGLGREGHRRAGWRRRWRLRPRRRRGADDRRR